MTLTGAVMLQFFLKGRESRGTMTLTGAVMLQFFFKG